MLTYLGSLRLALCYYFFPGGGVGELFVGCFHGVQSLT